MIIVMKGNSPINETERVSTEIENWGLTPKKILVNTKLLLSQYEKLFLLLTQ
ncbi:MAG: hypothetical protein ucyna2_00469 [Candidatus Atelocyanobacterium thalassa isolate SIO64986]|uniref:Uncharacterized protein n=2 Tax=Candidatus Atelocyanobacterium thalassae TaxID=713887 RepID=A0A086CHD3_9CHRO|nr:MAG: hypothetical protein ucyna2_00469 [Candidatus Atelocyanobacterium thalassa isolate SIO64986]